MASEGVTDWDEPLPTSESTEDADQKEMTYNECIQQEQMRKLQKYLDMMAYEPITPPRGRPRSESLAKPKQRRLTHILEHQMAVTTPKMKRDRIKSMVGWTDTITTE